MVVHSDRGGQFRSRAFRAVLKAARLTGSMGRVAAAGDNAAMESFYSLLQKNVLNRRRAGGPATSSRYEIVVWIEHTYNRRRRQRALGKLTPVEFELAFTHHLQPTSSMISHNHRQPNVQQTRSIPTYSRSTRTFFRREGVALASSSVVPLDPTRRGGPLHGRHRSHTSAPPDPTSSRHASSGNCFITITLRMPCCELKLDRRRL